MKVVIGENELGLIKKGFGGAYLYYRNGEYIYDIECNNKNAIIMTWKEFKERYPVEAGHCYRRKQINNLKQ